MIKKEDSTSNSDIFLLTKVIVLESFDEWTYTKGEGYFYANAVKSWKSAKTGITGKVKGNSAPYYSVILQIKNDRLNGSCSCPLGTNCKHCVALGLQWLDDNTPLNTNNNNGKQKAKKEEIDEYIEEDVEDNDDCVDLEEDYDENEEEEEDELGEYEKKERFKGNNIKRSKEQKKTKEKTLLKSLDIPANLEAVPIQDINAYLQSLSRTDLENLVRYFIPMLTRNQKITIFSPEFIVETWKKHLTRLDEDFKANKRSNVSQSQSFELDENDEKIMDFYSPLKIFEQINDNGARLQCIQSWFKGYVDLINKIKKECNLRGMSELEGEDLYEYYKNEEYDKMKEEFEEDQSEKGDRGRYYDDYDELESYEDFNLDTSTLRSYLENFFNWIFAPIQEICEYILHLNQINLKPHVDYLIREGLQWLIDLELPTKDFEIDTKNISTLQDLKTTIVSKLAIITTAFSKDTDQIDFLFHLFAQNPSQRIANLVWTQFQHMTNPEKKVLHFIHNMLENYSHNPKWEKFDLINQLIRNYSPSSISIFLEISINTLPKSPDVKLIIKEIFSILTDQPIAVVLELESALLKSIQKIPKKAYAGKENFYLETIDCFVNYFHQQKMTDHAFTLLVDFAKIYPKEFTFSHYQTIKKFKPLLTDQFVPEVEYLISSILQKGNHDVKFQLLLDLGRFDEACGLLKDFYKSTYFYDNNSNPQWGAIMRLIPNLPSITDENKENIIQCLKYQISLWLSSKYKHRPDASIAESIGQIKTTYLSFKTRDGAALWQQWFKAFSNTYWRLHNLRSALLRKGIEMKKN